METTNENEEKLKEAKQCRTVIAACLQSVTALEDAGKGFAAEMVAKWNAQLVQLNHKITDLKPNQERKGALTTALERKKQQLTNKAKAIEEAEKAIEQANMQLGTAQEAMKAAHLEIQEIESKLATMPKDEEEVKATEKKALNLEAFSPHIQA